MSIGNLPGMLSQRILVGIIVVGRLGVCGGPGRPRATWARRPRGSRGSPRGPRA